MDTGLTVEGVDLETRVVGEAVDMVMVKNILCFLVGVGLQAVARLGDILMAADVVERNDLKRRTENLTDFL